MEKGWWNRFTSRVSGRSRNAVSATESAGGEAFDAVELPPGASTDDEPTSGSSNGDTKDGKKKGGKSKDEPESDDAVVDDEDNDDSDDEDEDGNGDEDDLDDESDDDEPDADDKNNKSGGKSKSSSRGKKEAPMDDKNKNGANAAPAASTTEAPANTTNTTATAAEHPVLKAALAAGIDTEAKFGALQASAKVGESAIATARTDAKAAAVAYFGQAQPEKLESAEKMVDGMNDLSALSLLTENWHAGAPGGNRAQNANGGGKRQTRSNAPAAPSVPAAGGGNDGGKKPAAEASTSAPSSGNVYAQYNKPK